MLIGSWIVNVAFGVISFLIVFVASFGNNLVSTTLVRSLLAFIVTYILIYLFRWLWAIASKHPDQQEQGESGVEETADKGKESELNEEQIERTSQYVKDLMADKGD